MTSIASWLASQPSNTSPDYNKELKLLLCHLFKQNTAWLYSHDDTQLSSSDLKQLNQWVGQLEIGMPLAYITGQKAFWDLQLEVNEHTLIPRPDTELLIETVIDLKPQPKSIIDLGTGSGAIALSLVNSIPDVEVTAIDFSKQALATAQRNAQLNNINQIEFICSNWFDEIAEKTFDLIVSNPPYIAADDEHLYQLRFEPISALVAEDQGLADFKKITEQAPHYLNSNGVLMFEHGWNQHKEVENILSVAGFSHIRSRRDIQGHHRITWGCWIKT